MNVNIVEILYCVYEINIVQNKGLNTGIFVLGHCVPPPLNSTLKVLDVTIHMCGFKNIKHVY